MEEVPEEDFLPLVLLSTTKLVAICVFTVLLIIVAVVAAIRSGTSADRSIGRDPEAGKKPRDPDRHNR